MDYEGLISKLIKRGDVEALNDGFSLCRELENKDSMTVYDEYGEDSTLVRNEENFAKAHFWGKEIRKAATELVKSAVGGKQALDLYYHTLLFDAPYDFDVYLRTIEFKQSKAKQFYAPRRHYLKPIVDAYQEVLDGKLHLLTVSLVKRAGKSQLGINFVNMMSGRNPHRSSLMEGAGDDLVKSFYKGCLEYLEPESEYTFHEIFPKAKLVQTNADTKVINLDKKSRFPTIMCRSIDARQVGLSEATNVLYLDDCVEGYAESKNRARLDEKWHIISGDIIGRAVEGTPIVAAGTRYSIYDPIGRLQEEARKQGWSYKAIEIPALDPITEESNYQFRNPKTNTFIFTTKFFKEQRDMLSPEQFASEFQQQPFESKGILFPEDRLNRYFELPVDREPDSIMAVCDTAEGKGDSTMMPVAYIYGEDVFIHDCVFSNATPEHTKPRCAKVLFDNKVASVTFESNAAGKYFARDVEELLKELGGRCSFKTKYTVTNKHTRIELASDYIVKHFFFKDKSLYAPNSDYGLMMRELITYTRLGKVEHDDSPDGLSLLENELRTITNTANVRIARRIF